MSAPDIQILFFQRIKAKLQSHLSMVEEVAELLDISTDSAYRRIRGEKPVSFEELRKLALHFKVSIDHLLNTNTANFIFSDNVITKGNYDFETQLEFHLQGLAALKSQGHAEIIFFTRDISIYYFYQVPELLAFKYFYWMQTVFGNPDFLRKKFSIDEYLGIYADKGRKAALLYCETPGAEIWALEHINLTLQQINFFRETGMFKSQHDIAIIYDKLIDMINHIEIQAELGKKFLYNETVQPNSGSFEMYVNEFMIGGNNILVKLNDRMVTFINHSIVNYLSTDDPAFCSYVMKEIDNVIRKSDLISRIGEKQRRNFFNKLRLRIAENRK
jgi:transcriptional regulator with XRE-family HTH domain